ncbi:unnamed protein product [Dibothriocephalus latus]|uniref:Sushi domain-containing protein n=1 Tax=Dibothriocephalus latus TaxID=60516 RepID=A0A3P7LTQ7_DIBLA|nr:unnamed protein product [Dibothriocephalus latus]
MPFLVKIPLTFDLCVLTLKPCTSHPPASLGENYNLEVYDQHAKCFSTAPNWRLTDNKTVFHPPIIGAACFKYRCSPDEGGLIIQLAGGLEVPCPKAELEQRFDVCIPGHNLTVSGAVLCPPCLDFCEQNSVSYGSWLAVAEQVHPVCGTCLYRPYGPTANSSAIRVIKGPTSRIVRTWHSAAYDPELTSASSSEGWFYANSEDWDTSPPRAS